MIFLSNYFLFHFLVLGFFLVIFVLDFWVFGFVFGFGFFLFKFWFVLPLLGFRVFFLVFWFLGFFFSVIFVLPLLIFDFCSSVINFWLLGYNTSCQSLNGHLATLSS